MTHKEYVDRLNKMMNADHRAGWTKLVSDLRKESADIRSVDAKMTLLMQGLALQIERFLSHGEERKQQFEREAAIQLNAEPIDSEPDLTI